MSKQKITTENEKRIMLSGLCTIQAAAEPKEGEVKKLPRVTMQAYNGGKMHVGYWGDVVVDLDGLEVSDVIPILYAHSSYNIDNIVGQTDAVNKSDKLSATGTVMGDSDTVKKMLALAKNGYTFQTSIGADPRKTREISATENEEVNGQMIQGPFTLVTQSVLKEISILPLGADKSTKAAIAASHEQGQIMKPDNTKPEPTAEDIRAAAVAEETRILEVRNLAKDYPEISASAVKDGWSKEKTEMAIKDATIKAQAAEITTMKVQAERPNVPNISTGAKLPITASAIEAATALQAGLKMPEKAYTQETLEAADGIRINSFTDLVRACLAQEGKTLNATRHETREFLQAAFSTAAISNVISNVANKFIRQGFGTVEDTWRKVANIRSVVDFKANTGVSLIMANLLQSLNGQGEIQHGALSDEVRTIQVDTKALMLAITRKNIINDDTGVFTDLPVKLGFAAARTFNTDFWTAFTGAVATAFPTTNASGNYIKKVLDLAGLSAAEEAFLNLKDADGNPIGADASVLLVSPANATMARQLFASTNLTGGTSAELSANIFAGRFEPAITRYLTGAPWALVANPMAIPMMEAAFLNGRQEPFVESAETDFNTLGIQLRCYYDYGVAFAEPKAAVYSKGANT